MRWALYIAGFAIVVVAAAWSYRVTYATQGAFDAAAKLRGEIRREREAIAVLEAEWAWLNAPARLSRLVAENNDILGLAPMTPDVFAVMSEIETPSPDDGLEPVAIIDLDEAGPETIFAPSPRPRPVTVPVNAPVNVGVNIGAEAAE